MDIRPLRDSDSLTELTDLLHRAYKPLADAGMLFFASYQSEEDTRNRVEHGHCFVMEQDGQLIGTITTYRSEPTSPCAYYRRPNVWVFGQFAVDPALQRAGAGSALINHVEGFARANGAREMACDTAESARDLIAFYMARGYLPASEVQWQVTNYRSVVLSKRLVNS